MFMRVIKNRERSGYAFPNELFVFLLLLFCEVFCLLLILGVMTEMSWEGIIVFSFPE
jgi:hypothetical protein